MAHRHISVSTTAIACALASIAAPALAQTAPNRSSVEEIVVTANKRAENVQDVPLAVSVLAPAQLQASGVREFQDLSKISPSLTVRPAEHPVNANVSMRGVGTFAFSIGVESSVAVLVDEVPLAFQARAFTDLPDVQRIEVLRGPQSTLYGKAASAGLINIITRDPTKDFEAHLNGLATTDSEFGGNFTVSGPITPELGYVLSGSYSHYDGNVKNLFNDKDLNGRRVINTRGKLRWKPASNATFTLSANFVDGKTTVGRPFIRVAPNALFRNTPGLTFPVVQPGVTVGLDNTDVSNNYNSRTAYQGYGGYLRGEVGVLGEHTLISITSYDHFRLNDYLDHDDTSYSGAVGNNIQVGQFRSRLWTQELRLQSPGNKPFRYTVGGYFSSVHFARPFYRGPAFSLANWDATSDGRQFAGFVQADWEFLPKFTLTGGGRVQNEKIDYTFRDILNNGYWSGGASDTAATYKASLRYEPTPALMFFGTIATGYKGQTYDLSTGFNQNRALAGPIKPEKSANHEIGARMQFFDRKLTLNVTLFDTNYRNLQAQGIENLPDGTQNFRLANVGRLNTRGVEVEAMARPTYDWTLSGSVTYLDATIKEFAAAQCYIGQTAAQGCTGSPARQNLAGYRPAQAPEWKMTASTEYAPELTEALTGVAQANWTYQSKVNYSISQDPETIQKGYHIVNIGLGLRAHDKKWEIIGFINNLFDKQYFPSLVNTAGNFNNMQATQAILPRDFRRYGGVRVGFNF